MLVEIAWAAGAAGVLTVQGWVVYRAAVRKAQAPGHHRPEIAAAPASPAPPVLEPVEIDLSAVQPPDPRPWWWYQTDGHRQLESATVPGPRHSAEMEVTS